MAHGCVCAVSTLAVAAALAIPARGQAVISTRSGVVHFFEGSVWVAGQPLQAHLGKFMSIPEGAELRTGQGRAEVLLTPGVFLRIGDKSAIRMIANALSNTRVELLAGSAIVDSAEPGADTSVTLIYKGWEAHLGHKGVYRMDCEPPRLWTREGEAEVSAGADGVPVSVGQGMDVPLAAVLAPEKSLGQPRDTLSDWADGRAESISTDNTIAANIEDPASISDPNLAPDDFTYFPMLGLSTYSLGLTSLYGSLAPSQPGFYSVYLPGYTSRPLFLTLRMPGPLYPLSRGGIYSPLSRGGIYTTPLPRGGIHAPPMPRAPVSHPAPVHPMPHPGVGGVHAGGHR